MYNDRLAPNDPLIGHHFTEQEGPELDPKDERLILMSSKNGFLIGRNSVLENDNARLQMKNDSLMKELRQERERNEKVTQNRDNLYDEVIDLERRVGYLKQFEPKDEENTKAKEGGEDAE